MIYNQVPKVLEGASIQRLTAISLKNWDSVLNSSLCNQAMTSLEQGQLLLLPELKFHLNQQEIELLSTISLNKNTKNISYNVSNGLVQGTNDIESHQEIRSIMNRFSRTAQSLITTLLPSYREKLQIGRTSLRPVEIAGRSAPSFRKDDTRLHVDAFPANPNQGRRILRIFYNYNPFGKNRVWRLGESFRDVADQFLPKIRPPIFGSRYLLKTFKITKGLRTSYDHYMLNLHDAMKYDLHYQKNADAETIELPAQTSWMVFTDLVSHAALSGQHVLEQTFYLPVEAMQDAERSPLRILEGMLGRKLT